MGKSVRERASLEVLSLLKKVASGEWRREFNCIKGSPKEFSLAFSLGVFIGLTPTIGFQTALCYSFARLVRKNFLVSLLGSCFVTGIPWFIPFVYYLEYRIGCFILKIPTLFCFPRKVDAVFLFSLGKPLLIGSILLAAAGAVFSFVVTFLILKFSKPKEGE